MDLSVAVDMVKKHEGFKSYGYFDSRGFLTIGHGILIDKAKGGYITKEESSYIVNQRIALLDAQLFKHQWYVDLSYNRKCAILDAVYQLGLEGFLLFKDTINLLSLHKYEEAADEFMDSDLARQTPTRAYQISNIIRTGEIPDGLVDE